MMMGDIDRNTQTLTSFDSRVTKVEDMVQQQAVSMARIDANIEAIRASVEIMAGR